MTFRGPGCPVREDQSQHAPDLLCEHTNPGASEEAALKLIEPTTAVAINALIAKANNVRKRTKSLVIVDARRVDQLNAHGPSDVALKLEKADSRCAADRVV